MGWKELAAVAVVTAALVGCVSSQPEAASTPTAVTPSAESAAITASNGRVRREGGRLTVTLGKGGTVEFTDYRGRQQSGKDWDSVTHIYRGLLGDGRYHLVERSAYGRVHDVLIEAVSGTSWSVPGSAYISPDGQRLLILPDDAGNKQLQIWALIAPRPKIEFDTQPALPVRFDRWTDNEHIALRVPDQGVMRTIILQRNWGAWDLPLPAQ